MSNNVNEWILVLGHVFPRLINGRLSHFSKINQLNDNASFFGEIHKFHHILENDAILSLDFENLLRTDIH